MKKEKIILYKSTETVFTHNGIRVLKPLQCTINRNLVDYTYDLDMVYPIDDTGYWKDIIEDRIIKANGQLFRIVHTDKSVIDNSITIYAKHIFFDLQKNFIEDTNVVVKNGNIALAQLLSATSFQHNFTGYSDIAKQNNFRCVRQNVLDALLGDQDASFINRWGGEFDVDNFNIKMVNQVGSDKGYKIKYGRNLTGLNFRTDYTNIITRIRPVGFDGIDLGDNNYVDSPNINNYSMPIIREMKYEHVKWSGSPNYEAPDENDEDDNSVVFDDLELARAELRRLASLEFTENEVDLPEINCEVNFIELSNTEEYLQFRNLEKISLGDIVTIEHKPLDINIKARCVSYVYDCLKQQYESIEIGHYQKNFFRETLNTNEKMENNDFDISEEIQSVYAQAISKMTEMMNNSMNGYVVLTNSEILIMDSPNKKEAKNVWKFNSSGIAHSSTGYEGEYTVGMTMDGHINGALITAGSIKADMLEAGTITTRELAVEIQTTINSAMTQETTQALITANLNQFESNLSQTFITEEEATKQIQNATEVAVEQATQSIVNSSVQKAMENVNDQLEDKLSDFSINTMNPALQQAMQETLQDSKDYVVEVTGDYYTKSETDSKISQTRESIELGISQTYETKENTSIRIEEAINGVNVGIINRVFGTAEEKEYTFTGVSNEVFSPYDISSDISDKEVIVSFEYDIDVTVQNGSRLIFQPYYISVTNQGTYSPTYEIINSTTVESINLKNQQVSFTTTFHSVQQDCKFRFRADGITGTFTVRKAQIKVGNKLTEWSIAPEDIEENANNYTVQQLTNYYTKNQTDSMISIAKDEINLGVSSIYETKANVTTAINGAKEYSDIKKDEAITSANNTLKTTISNYYTKDETNSAINIAKNEINLGVSSTYETKADTTTKINNALLQAKSYSDTKKDEAIASANNTLKTTISNYYTKQQTDSQINVAKDSIKSEVSNTYYTKNEISSSGAVNLIKNGGFEKGLEYWSINYSPSFELNQSWQNYDGKSLFMRTDSYGDGIFQFFKTEIGKTYTYSFYAQCEKCEFTVGVKNQHTHKVAVSPNRWIYYQGTFTATANNHDFVIFNMNKNTEGNIFIDNIMVNEGVIPAKYTTNYSEVYESIASNTSLINQTASTIRSEISSSFSSYYNKNETDKKIYEVNSSVTQTINNLKIQFSQSGGYNLFKNSNFHGGNDFWWNQSYNSPSGGMGYMYYTDQWGFPDREVNAIYYTLPVGKSNVEWGLAQTVETTIGKQYTISFYYAGHRCTNANIIIRKSDSSWLANQSFNPSNYRGGNSSANNWGRQVFTFTATETAHTIQIVMNNCSDSSDIGYLWIAKPQCEEGSVATAWSPHPSEVMTGITTISEKGITVSHSNANTTSSMDASGFRITRVSDGKNIFNATNGNLTMEGVLSTGSSGRRIVASDSNYKVYDGNTQKAFFGLRSNDGYISPMLSLSADAIGTTAYDGFSINMYKRNNNPSSSTVDYMDMAYLVSSMDDYSNLKMFGDGNIKISPVKDLEISTNYYKGSYDNPSGYEYVIAKFTSSSSSYYNARLEIDAIANTDMSGNAQGLVFEDSRNGKYTSVTVYVNPSTGERSFRPVTGISGTVYNGTSNALWKAVYSSNGTIQTSDSRYKAITDDADIYDCFKMVKDTKLYNYVMLDKNKEKMTQIELAESALFNVGEESSIQVGVMAQDLLKYKCGKQIVVHEDIKDDDGNIVDDIYSVNAYPFASAVMGGLQYEIKQREELSNIVLDLYQTILDLQQRIEDLEENR